MTDLPVTSNTDNDKPITSSLSDHIGSSYVSNDHNSISPSALSPSAYNPHDEETTAKQKHMKQQKKLVIIHAIFLLSISCISLPLLIKKETLLNKFYDDAQCCYCVWIGRDATATNGRKISWSPCVNNHDLYRYNDPNKVCTFDDNNKTYCAPFDPWPDTSHLSWIDWTKRKIFQRRQYSTTSSVAGLYKFHKYYPYYGIISIILTLSYIAFIIGVTFIKQKRLSVVLFIGNIVLSILCYYTYIKCYQYTIVFYDEMCNDPPPFNINMNNPRQCYQNAIPPFLEFNMELIVYFISIYVVYPIVFMVVVIMFSPCKKCNTRILILLVSCKTRIEYFLRYFGIFAGIYFVMMSCFILSYIVIEGFEGGVEYNLMSDWNIPSIVEEIYVIFVCLGLFIHSFDVLFLLDRCRQESKDILQQICCCVKKHNRYLSELMTSTDDYDNENETTVESVD